MAPATLCCGQTANKEASMLRGIALLPNSAGIDTAGEKRVSGETKEELLQNAWGECIGSQYVGSIYDVTGRTRLWEEVKGWLVEPTPA